MEVEKKVWPKDFERIKSGEKNFELRIADFKVKRDDVLILREWDPNKRQFTGRFLKKKCKMILKFNPLDFNTLDEIETFGFYLIEYGESE